MGTYYETGRRYNVTLENVLAVGTTSERGGTIDIAVKLVGPNGPQTSTVLHIPLDHVGVTVTPIPPTNWPPQPGDVWEADGTWWFTLASRDDEGELRTVVLINEEGRHAYDYFTDPVPWDDSATLLNNSTNLVLITRKGWPPPQDEPTHPDFTDEPPF